MRELRAVDYTHEGEAFQGLFAAPDGRGPHPAVLVMHDARGLGELTPQRARMLADNGFCAMAADMYGVAHRGADWRENSKLMPALHKDPQWFRGRVVAAFEALRALPQVNAGKIGAIGFCFGGQCVLELARSGSDLAAVVSFHGLLQTQLPAKAGEVKAKVLVLTGARDPFAPLEHVELFRQEMTAAGADWQVTIYGEGYHAFTDPGAAGETGIPGLRYDPLIDRLSWASAMAMLEATLR